MQQFYARSSALAIVQPEFSALTIDIHGDLSVLNNERAINSADSLASSYDAARVMASLKHPEEDVRITVQAHSYGTRATAYALTKTKYNVDAVYWFGSAGIIKNDIPSVDSLHVGNNGEKARDNVFAYTNADDGVARIAGIIGSRMSGNSSVTDPSAPRSEIISTPEVAGEGRTWPPRTRYSYRHVEDSDVSDFGNKFLTTPQSGSGSQDFRDSSGHDVTTEESGKEYPGYLDRKSYSGNFSRWIMNGEYDNLKPYRGSMHNENK